MQLLLLRSVYLQVICNTCITDGETDATTVTGFSMKKAITSSTFTTGVLLCVQAEKIFNGFTARLLFAAVIQAPFETLTVAITGIEQLSISS